MSKVPAFRFYPSDFWGSPDVQSMDLSEVGAYLSLLSNAWLSDRYGYLADDDEKLRRWSRMSRQEWVVSRDLLLSKFPIAEPGWRHNVRMVLEADKMAAYSASRSENGKKGGRPKHVVSKEKHTETIRESIDQSTEKLSVAVAVVSKNQSEGVSAPSEPHPDAAHTGKTKTAPVEEIYKAYPRKVGPRVAKAAIHKALARICKGECAEGENGPPCNADTAQRMLLRLTAQFAASPAGKNPDKKKIAHPATWFNRSSYFDDPSEWRCVENSQRSPRSQSSRVNAGEGMYDPNSEQELMEKPLNARPF